MDYLAYFGELLSSIWEWLQTEVLVPTAFIELGVIFLIYIISHFIKGKLESIVLRGLNKIAFLSEKQKKKIMDQVLILLVFAFLLWIYLILGEVLPLPNFISYIGSNIIFALIIFNLTLILLPRGTVVIKVIVFLVWSVALLNILGIYTQTINILEEIRFSSGNLDVSLMEIIRGVILFGILLWMQSNVGRLLQKRIQSSDSFTPSIKVLLNKLTRTVLYIIIIFITLSSLGVDLSSFAFLGGAIGVGLGFGLQKIVSNYISGIIILLDKSVKPGDIIQVGEVFGRIKSQETRFVSLVTRAGKEYLIPNEDFITNQVINWSYSDDLVRLEAEVGVSYKSDMQKVREILLQAAKDKDRVVEYPPPVCLLTKFANNTVNFQLRFWINDPAQGVTNIKSDILFTIWNLLKENGIQIAFPQRDIHFKSVSPEIVDALNHYASDEEQGAKNFVNQNNVGDSAPQGENNEPEENFEDVLDKKEKDSEKPKKDDRQ